jgi:hypothetical protein
MRVSVFFYKSIDRESVLWASLQALSRKYENTFWIGGSAGFGAEELSWQDAFTLAAKIAVTILKTESESVFNEMRLIVQEDVQESELLKP